MSSVKITTRFNPDMVMHLTEDTVDPLARKTEEVLRLKEQATIEALQKLGYSTPAETKKLKADLANAQAHIRQIEGAWRRVGGCSNHSCHIDPPPAGAMGTNGGCNCYGNRSKMMRLVQVVGATINSAVKETKQ